MQADIVAENHYLIPKKLKMQFCSKDSYLLFGNKINQDDNNQEDENAIQFGILKDMMEAQGKQIEMLS